MSEDDEFVKNQAHRERIERSEAELPATHLGDGAYVEWNGYAFVVYTSNGIERTNEVYLEPLSMKALAEFVARVIK